MTSDSPLNATETRDLRAFAGTMIPASERHGVPGADDETMSHVPTVIDRP